MLNCEWGRLFTCQEISALKSPAAADEGISDVEEVIVIYCYKCSLICAKKKLKLALRKRS
jgi:hypothetical protein